METMGAMTDFVHEEAIQYDPDNQPEQLWFGLVWFGLVKKGSKIHYQREEIEVATARMIPVQ
eukprot:scaffold125666_cov31-Attheya_sp.AAC.3